MNTKLYLDLLNMYARSDIEHASLQGSVKYVRTQ